MKNLFIIAFVLINQLIFSQNDTINISDDISLIKISPNSYIHLSYINIKNYGKYPCNGFVYTSNGKAFLCDTPINDSLTNILLDYLTNEMKLEIVGFAPNHWHSDCMGGISAIHQKGIKSYASARTIEIAKQKGLPLPQNSFTDSLSVQIGDSKIELYYPGGAHTYDNITVWFPDDKILFAGCMLKDANTQNMGNTTDSDIESWPQTIKKLENKYPDARILIPGHGNYGNTELFVHTLNLLNNIK